MSLRGMSKHIVARALLLIALAVAVAAPALADDPADKKANVDEQISALSSKLAAHRQSEQELRGEIDQVTSRIRTLEANVGDVSLKLSTLERDLSLHRERLTKLNNLFTLQSNRLLALKQQYRDSVRRLDKRLVALYVGGRPSVLEFVLGSSSIDDVLNKVDYMARIAKEDRRIADEVARAKLAVRNARQKTKQLRTQVAGASKVIAARAAQVRETRDALVGARDSLSATRQDRLVALSGLTAKERAEAEEIDGLQAASAQLAAQIRAAQSSASTSTSTSTAPAQTSSSGGMIWPVSGPVTSPFGWRWGRMHEGIDIGVGTGTPIHAAASGTVINCGWAGGYGNLVAIDHGGGIATDYGHQSSIAVSCGQQVSQGQVIGYVGSTGHSTGPHLHFEVRVNGAPADPLGYL